MNNESTYLNNYKQKMVLVRTLKDLYKNKYNFINYKIYCDFNINTIPPELKDYLEYRKCIIIDNKNF